MQNDPISKVFQVGLAHKQVHLEIRGKPCELDVSYDFTMEFSMLPKINRLLIFNDSDDGFPAACSVLSQKQAEDYLDPQSLIMIDIAFTRQLKKLSVDIRETT